MKEGELISAEQLIGEVGSCADPQEHICTSSYRRVANALIHENCFWRTEGSQLIEK